MTTAALPAQTRRAAPGMLAQIRAEWTKIRSARALYIQILCAIVLGIGFSALICFAVASSWDKTSAADKADFHTVMISLAGTGFADIVLIVTGVTLVASEYTSGMVRLTMTVTPSRLRVFFAKLIVILFVCWAISIVFVLGAFFAGQAVLSTHSGIPTASLGDSDAQRGILATWLTAPLFPLIGAALGAILRSTASAITATLGLVFLPAIFGGLLPDSWQKHVIAYLPGNAGDALQRADHNYLTYISPGTAIVTLLVWLALFFIVASIFLQRRDV
ncbi:MAG TPA: ABC transporter permease subunit [Dehalococcoidia bacterium]|nr:ABC transporter permease subunit [Dehalococcoidia bacterium]